MRALIQRVSRAKVEVNKEVIGQIKKGLLVFIGVETNDTEVDVEYILHKLVHLRIFSDENGKMNHSVFEMKGEVLLVSQFTLHASTKKGNRPSYTRSASPELANSLYEECIKQAEALMPNKIQCGKFGADMKIDLINDGPVTILIDSKKKEF